MKKILILLCAIIVSVCAFAVIASAEETTVKTYYVVQSLESEVALELIANTEDEIPTDSIIPESRLFDDADSIFANSVDGESYEFIFMENIKTESHDAYKITTAITVTVYYNGFSHYINGGGANKYTSSAFYINNSNMTLRLIGTKAIDGDDGSISNTFTYNYDTTTGNVDIYQGGKVYAWMTVGGNAYVENVRSHTNEELVYFESGGSIQTYTFKNCALKSNGYSICLLAQSSVKKNFTIENGIYYGVDVDSPTEGSYIRNAHIYRVLNYDSWYTENEVKFEITDTVIDATFSPETDGILTVATNCNFNSGITLLGDSTGGANIVLNDCTWSGDINYNNKDGKATVYTSPDCVNPSTTIIYTMDGSSVDETAEVNPALGHTASGDVITIAYTNGFASAGFCDFNCSICQTQFTEVEATAPAIIEPLGYSYKEDTTNGSGGITGGYALNNVALSRYEKLTGDKVSFGVVVINPEYAGDSFFTDKKLTVTDKAVQVEITDNTYASFSYSLTGFESGFEELDLVISAYAYSNINELEFIQKQYDEGETSTAFETFAKSDATLYSVNCASVKNADPDYIAPTKEEE